MQSICVLRLSAIGDVCNAVAVVQAIQRHYPQASLTWVVGRVEAELIRGLPGVELVVFDKRQGWAAYQALWQRFRARRFDVLLHMQVALRANLASLCIPAKRKIGFDWDTAKELHALFMRERVEPVPRAHVLDGFAQFAQALGVTVHPPRWDMPIAPEYKAWAQSQIQASGFARHLIVCPAASAAERNWLAERYAAVMDHAAQRGFAIWLCGSPAAADRDLADQIKAYCKLPSAQLFDRVGQTHLQQLLALMQQASVVLAPDSGPAHMATSVGKPVIGLYGHSNPARTGPYGSPYVVEVYHQHLLQQTGKRADQCRWGTRVKGEHIMRSIEVASVVSMFDRVVKECRL